MQTTDLGRRRFLMNALAMSALGLMPGNAFAAPIAKVKALGVLRVAVYKDNRPWSWRQDGKLIGIDADLGAALAKALGVRVDLAELIADESVDDDLRNGVWKGGLLGFQPADIMLHIPFDRGFAARNEQVAIIAPYYRETFQFACVKGEIDCNAIPSQFRGHKLAAEIDSIPDFYLMGTFGGILAKDVAHFPSGADAVNAIIDGHAEGVLASRAQIEAVLADRKPANIARRTTPLPAFPSPGWDIGMAVKENSRNLGDSVEAILTEMAASGELKAIFDRYGVTYAPALAA
ncbi:substrate-binding periplasmic protein [Sphingobium phenoxybenzoativorans]|uniref:substrate-binding periplasmic protein n=1 Tax=Sphingobium phenoxybenzoativorans TaxID=1592790 RepID=UPI000872BBAD|nr:transporter substrate-binding domain-containing protein [Sphingobium phenoxybenzoativorans]